METGIGPDIPRHGDIRTIGHSHLDLKARFREGILLFKLNPANGAVQDLQAPSELAVCSSTSKLTIDQIGIWWPERFTVSSFLGSDPDGSTTPIEVRSR